MRLHILSFFNLLFLLLLLLTNTYTESFFSSSHYHLASVSHTTDDMIFQWDPSVPLVVDDNIELPQLALVQNHTADCECERKLYKWHTSFVDFFFVVQYSL